jgi:hypothetical protein
MKMESGKKIIKQHSEKIEKNKNNHKYKWKINKNYTAGREKR